MSGYKPLNASEIEEIAARFYNSRANKSVKKEKPVIVLVAAQPGAGKTEAAFIMKNELSKKGGFVHVDADKMRDMIPLYGIKADSKETQSDAGALANLVRTKSIEGKRNIIEEGTFRNSEGLSKYIDGAKNAGYSIEMVAVATNGKESLFGIYQRCEKQHEAGLNNPRFVPPDYHDDAMRGFDTSVATQGHRFDRLRVITRDGRLLFDSANSLNAFKTPLEAVEAGRTLSDDRLHALASGWQQVIASAKDRGAEQGYQNSAVDQANIVNGMKNDRIHTHALKTLDSNLGHLSSDERFKAHGDSEMLKAAYYRGFHEKAAFFAGVQPDYGRYDIAAGQKDMVHNLPDVFELQVLAYERSHEHSARTKDIDSGLER